MRAAAGSPGGHDARMGIRLSIAALTALHLLAPAAALAREPVLGGPCEGCELVFEGMPPRIEAAARIARADEPGESLRIEGTVRRRSGEAAAGVTVYAYHTDSRGIYPARGRARERSRHGALRGWARTDASGRYRFDTIRPAGYPGTALPQHVHMHVIEPGRGTYWIDDLVFTDDPRLTDAQRRSHAYGRGGSGVAAPVRTPEGRWRVQRDIVLGEAIPGYPD